MANIPTGVKVVNLSVYDTAEVRRICRRVLREAEVTGVTITVRHLRRGINCPGFTRGRYREFWYPSRGEDRPQITVSLPRPESEINPTYEPYKRSREQGKEFPIEDWREALVAVLGHEAHHHLQTPRNGYGTVRKRGRYVEVECDLAAFRAVAAYRKWR